MGLEPLSKNKNLYRSVNQLIFHVQNLGDFNTYYY